MVQVTGGCMCGAVRYEITGDVKRAMNCHCDDCRKNTGAAFATNVFFDCEDVRITAGETAKFTHLSDAGNRKTKEFCPTCGSQLFSSTEGRQVMSVKVGSLEDAGFVKPEGNVYCSRALSYVELSEDIPSYEKMAK